MALKNKQTCSLALLKGIKESPKSTLLNSIIILFLFLIGAAHLRTALLAQLAFTKAEHSTTYSFSQTDPDVLSNLARQEHLGNANLNLAQALYKRALQNFILHVPSWLGLIEVYNDLGDEQRAKEALAFLERNFQNTGDTAWSKAILADTLDHDDILISNLIWLADKHPDKKGEIFAIADLNWNEPQILLNKFNKTYYLDILDYYIRANELEKSKIVWQEIVKEKLNDHTNSLAYINYLLLNNEFDNAVDAWSSSFNKDGTLIFNGNFEKPLTGSAFGWRVSKGKGIASKQAGYSGGIQISFDGSENASFQLSQIIPLLPGKYEFSSSVETDELTTDQRPFWMITGHQCQGLKVEDEMVAPTHHPETFIIPFTVPSGCKAIQISLRRNKSFMIDNKISGKVTVGKLALTSLSEPIDKKAVADKTSETLSMPTEGQLDKPAVVKQKTPPVQKVETIEPIVKPSVEQKAQPVMVEQKPPPEPAASEAETIDKSLQKVAAMPHYQDPEEIAQPFIPEPEIKTEAEHQETEPATKYKPRKRANITINKIVIRP